MTFVVYATDHEYADPLQRPDWHNQAACRAHPDLSWFPGKGQSTTEQLQICATCPVKTECAKAGAREAAGIWGGMKRNRTATVTRVTTTPRTGTAAATIATLLTDGQWHNRRQVAADLATMTARSVEWASNSIAREKLKGRVEQERSPDRTMRIRSLLADHPPKPG